MKELKCPHCGTTFQVDEADYANIVSQIRNSEFDIELAKREQSIRRELEAQQKATEAQSQSAHVQELGQKEMALSAKDAEIERLKLQISTMEQAGKLSLAEALAKKNEEIADLKAKVKEKESEGRLAILEEKSRSQQAISDKETEIAKIKGQAELERKEALLKEKNLVEKHQNELKAMDEQVAFYKDFKARRSTKDIGESLEQYCYKLYSQSLRPVMPDATFGKDNDVVDGTKGDFVFRDSVDGTEYISIMFEMKNEADETASKHKNSEFFAKLDKDRQQKGCEFAVLVSMLEMDNDMYNEGIVVAPGYEKMYVVRPENFIPLITLLVQTSKKALEFKKELEEARKRNVDVTGFEDKLRDCQRLASDHYDKAEKYFEKVIEDIDATIKKLEDMKKHLTTTGNQLRLANNTVQDISVRKLTWGNDTMKAKFEEARVSAAIEEHQEDVDNQ